MENETGCVKDTIIYEQLDRANKGIGTMIGLVRLGEGIPYFEFEVTFYDWGRIVTEELVAELVEAALTSTGSRQVNYVISPTDENGTKYHILLTFPLPK